MTGRWLTLILFFFTLNLFSRSLIDTVSNHDSTIVVGKISITGNKITKEKIITREVEFSPGDRLSKPEFVRKINSSKKNILNLQLFNFVTFKTYDSSGVVNVNINVVERWYLWPVPIFGLADRNFNVWWETKDWGRVNYGIDVKHDNFLGLMQKMHLILQYGYDRRVIGKWIIPYIDKKQNLGMVIAGGMQFNHETAFKDTLNRPVFYRFENNFARKMYFAEFGLTYRHKFHYSHFFDITYNNLTYNDSLLIFNPDLTYGKSHYQYFNVFYLFKIDYRDYAPYPLNGHYFDFSFNKTGLGILTKDVNNWSVNFNFDQYFEVYKRFYFAYRLSAYYSTQNKTQPYFVSTGIGFKHFDLRGYELEVIRGQRIMMFKSNVKFELIPMKVHKINFIKSEKFNKLFYAAFLNLFYDMGYVDDIQTYNNNPLGNEVLWSVGAGLDIISFYSIVVRLEYSINKQKQTGFYVAFTSPI